MSVWPECGTPCPSLCGTEGELVSVRISIEPRLLERLLDALASLDFPINPQIYHNGTTVWVRPDGSETSAPATVVQFPAWAGWLPDVRATLERSGLIAAALSVRGMLEELAGESPARVVIRGAAA